MFTLFRSKKQQKLISYQEFYNLLVWGPAFSTIKSSGILAGFMLNSTP